MSSIWEELGISQTDDRSKIRKAYAARLKEIDQLTEGDQFQALRRAYEQARRYAPSKPSPVPAGAAKAEKSVSPSKSVKTSIKPEKTSSLNYESEDVQDDFEKTFSPDNAALSNDKINKLVDEVFSSLDTGRTKFIESDLRRILAMPEMQLLQNKERFEERITDKLLDEKMSVRVIKTFAVKLNWKYQRNSTLSGFQRNINILLEKLELHNIKDLTDYSRVESRREYTKEEIRNQRIVKGVSKGILKILLRGIFG